MQSISTKDKMTYADEFEMLLFFIIKGKKDLNKSMNISFSFLKKKWQMDGLMFVFPFMTHVNA